MGWYLLVGVFVLYLTVPVQSAVPLGCTSQDNEGHYECDYRVISLPLSASSFSTQPQHITFIGVSGLVPDRAFSNLGSSASVFPLATEPNQINFVCLKGNALILHEDALKGLGWLNVLTFTDCEFSSLPDNVLASIDSLDTLDFYGGSFDDLGAASLAGFSIALDSSLPEPHGRLAFQYTKFPSGRIPSGFLSPVSSASEIQFLGNGITSLDFDTFGNMTKLTSLTLSDNEFTYLPLEFLDGLTGLDTLYISGIPWDCSACGATWFLQWAFDNYVTVQGSLLCSDGVRMRKYLMDTCEGYIYTGASTGTGSGFDSQAGLTMNEQFMSTQDVVALAMCVVVTIISLVNLGLIIHMKKGKGGIYKSTSSSSSKSKSSTDKSKSSSDKSKSSSDKSKSSSDKSGDSRAKDSSSRANGAASAWEKVKNVKRGSDFFKNKAGRITPSEVKINVWE